VPPKTPRSQGRSVPFPGNSAAGRIQGSRVGAILTDCDTLTRCRKTALSRNAAAAWVGRKGAKYARVTGGRAPQALLVTLWQIKPGSHLGAAPADLVDLFIVAPQRGARHPVGVVAKLRATFALGAHRRFLQSSFRIVPRQRFLVICELLLLSNRSCRSCH